MPEDERSITVVHSPQNTFRRAILVMFVVLGMLLFAGYREVRSADGRADRAVEQNDELQRSLDQLAGTLERLEEAERLDDEEQRKRSERTVAFIAAVLVNSSDPVLREAARQALEDLGADAPALDINPSSSSAPAPGPREPAAAPGPQPTSEPGAQPPAAPPSTEEPPPAPPPSEEPPGPVEQTVDDVVETVDDVLCGLLPCP